MRTTEETAVRPLLEVEDLRTCFRTGGRVVEAVSGVSLSIEPGEVLGLVGESGSGKSVTSLSILGLLPPELARVDGGSISYLGRELVRLPGDEMRRLRGQEISMIFQEPDRALNPVVRVGDQLVEALRVHQDLSRVEAKAKAIELFCEVGIPEPLRRFENYPHEMSGGQKQRVMIAMALCCDPRLLIADEPTTALDVTTQAQILLLLRKLRDERNMAVLFITHDLGVIAEIADRVAVMYRGEIVEYAPVLELFSEPQHPYTRGLLACRPRLQGPRRRLPTVSDFLLEREVDGVLEVLPRQDAERVARERAQRGRKRLLHPRSVLADAGLDSVAEDEHTELVAEGVEPLVGVHDLVVHFPIREGLLRRTVGHVEAVRGVGFNIYPGQTLGLVGESGCGKTTTGLALMRLSPVTSGRVIFRGQDITELRGADLRGLRSRMQMVMQDPHASLNPRLTVESTLLEAMSIHGVGGSKAARLDRAAQLLVEVGLEPDHLRRYPHQFSGGQQQRISIARALAVEPEFLVLDEAVSALDVSVQAQVLNLLKDLQEDRGLTYLFISHDLSVVKFMADMMAVMREGRFVEFGPAQTVYAAPRDRYTAGLIESVPDDSIEAIRDRHSASVG